jgi:outer membrane protein assembly factor BamB
MLHKGISRRDVLRAGAALGALPFLPKRAWAAPQQGGSFAYFSDTHVSVKRNVAECRAMLEEMRGLYSPAFAINGGDVVDYGWKAEYDSYDGVLAGLDWRTYHIPGNHDVRWSPLGLQIFNKRVGAPFRSFDAFGCKFILLDSTVPLSHWGHYESEQLRWAERELRSAGPEMPIIVGTHHWVGRDAVMIDNESALMRVLEPYNVKLILTGHGHNDLLWEWDGAVCTMNKGLYQGSYQRVDVDWSVGQLRLSRRAAPRGRMSELAAVSLRTMREKRPIWRIPMPEAVRGTVLAVQAEGAKELRWNDGKWEPLEGGSIRTEGQIVGSHLLHLRNDQRMASLPLQLTLDSSKIGPVWRKKLPGGVMSHLVLAEGKLFVSCMDGSVLAFDPETGRIIFERKTAGYCHSSPAVAENTLVVGSADGFIYTLDAGTGKEKWKFETGGPVYASAAIARGLAMIGSGDGKIYALDLETGERKWVYEMPQSDTAFTQSVPQTDGERFYFGGWDKFMYALNVANGELVWRKVCTDRTFAFSPAIGGPAMDETAVYIPANGNELYAFRKTDGEQLWKYSSPGDKVGYSAPCLNGGKIYIGCLGDKGQARCVSAADGKELWCAEVGAVIYDSSPAHDEGLVCVGSVNGTLHVIEADSGRIVVQYRMPPGHFLSSPAMQGRRIFAATYSDELVCLEVSV